LSDAESGSDWETDAEVRDHDEEDVVEEGSQTEDIQVAQESESFSYSSILKSSKALPTEKVKR
jgi:hypothetical protein